MASRSNPYTKDHDRHFRLLSLLLDLGTRAVRRRFEEGLNYHKYTDLQAFLNINKTYIEKDNYINKEQLKLLYPQGQDATIETLDLSLLTTLIQSYLQPLYRLQQNLGDLRKIRNDLQHNPHAGLSLREFNLKWSELSKLLGCLDRDPLLSKEIDEYERKPFSDTKYELLKVKLGEFSDQVSCTGEKVQKLDETVSGAGAKVQNLDKTVSGAGEKVDTFDKTVSGAGAKVKELDKTVSGAGAKVKELIQVVSAVGAEMKEINTNVKGNLQNPRLERSASHEIEEHNKAQQRVKKKDRKELLQELSKALKEDYSARYSTIPFIPWVKTSRIAIDDIYIPLKMKEKRETGKWEKTSSQQFKSMEEALEKSDPDRPFRSIVEANAGCGKSTLCHKVLHDWSKDGIISTKYELVILLKAREFSSQQDLSSAILDKIPSSMSRTHKEEIEQIMLDKTIKKLIVIDGYDELKEKSEQKDLHNLFDNTLYETCDLLVTTRPVFVEQVKKFQFMNRVLRISLLENNDIKDYARKFFKYKKIEDDDVVDAFYKEVTKTHVNQLAREPLTLLFLCIVYEDRKSLPKIRTHLYEDLLKVLQSTYAVKGRPEISDGDWNQLLLCLGNLAFNKLTEKEGGILVFKEKDVKKYEVDLELACAVGLLTRADPPQEEPVSEYSYQSVMNKYDKFYQFAHLSLQECLAARYFYNTFDNDTSNENFKTLHQKGGQYFNFTHFVCGYVSLDKEVNNEKLTMLNILVYALIKYVHSTNKYYYLLKDFEFWEETGRNPLYKWAVVDNNAIHQYSVNVPDGKTFCAERVRYLYIPGISDKEPHNIIKCKHGTCLRNICNILKDTCTLEHIILKHLKCDCKHRADGLSELIQNNKNIEKFCIEDCDITSDIIESNFLTMPTTWLSYRFELIKHSIRGQGL